MEAYLDNAATTKPGKEVIERICSSLDTIYGNPNSLHRIGRLAEDEVNEARRIIGESINASKEEIIFTASASEGNNQVIRSFIKEGAHFITTKIEHPSVLRTMEYAEKHGVRVSYLGVDSQGRIDLAEFRSLFSKATTLVSIMMVNNEIGSVNPVEEIGSLMKDAGYRARFHVDAVQGYLKLAIDVKKMNIDFLTTSAHKVHGPKGVGFLYVRKGLKPESLIIGGGQEQSMRAGTVNVPAILGFSETVKIMAPRRAEHYDRILTLKKNFMEEIAKVPDVRVNSPLETGSPYVLNISAPFLRAEVLLHYLSEKGVYVSTGSACSSKNTRDSHVLIALGLKDAEIKGSIRITFSAFTTQEETAYSLDVLKEAFDFLRRR